MCSPLITLNFFNPSITKDVLPLPEGKYMKKTGEYWIYRSKLFGYDKSNLQLAILTLMKKPIERDIDMFTWELYLNINEITSYKIPAGKEVLTQRNVARLRNLIQTIMDNKITFLLNPDRMAYLHYMIPYLLIAGTFDKDIEKKHLKRHIRKRYPPLKHYSILDDFYQKSKNGIILKDLRDSKYEFTIASLFLRAWKLHTTERRELKVSEDFFRYHLQYFGYKYTPKRRLKKIGTKPKKKKGFLGLF